MAGVVLFFCEGPSAAPCCASGEGDFICSLLRGAGPAVSFPEACKPHTSGGLFPLLCAGLAFNESCVFECAVSSSFPFVVFATDGTVAFTSATGVWGEG